VTVTVTVIVTEYQVQFSKYALV